VAEHDLDGFVVGVTADRRADEQAELLRRRGAAVIHAPVLKTLPLVDGGELRSTTDALVAHRPDVVIANTGIGMRGWISAAESWGIGDAVLATLRQARVVARGPKAAGAVVTAGADVEWRCPSGRLRDVVAHLIDGGVDGCRVALQLDGSQCTEAAERLRAAGADVVALPVYRWVAPDDTTAADRLVDAIARAAVDAVTFTSAPAIDALVAIAGGRDIDISGAFAADVLPVCVGPVCHEAAVGHGLSAAVQPERALLGAMVSTLADELVERRWVVSTNSGELHLAGTSVVVDGERIELTDRERAVLRVLARQPGTVVSKRVLLQEVWGDADADAHALEVTVGRLRRRLGAAGGSVRTVIRRGYQLV
jgi:uroporphyrinogen-III synthase